MRRAVGDCMGCEAFSRGLLVCHCDEPVCPMCGCCPEHHTADHEEERRALLNLQSQVADVLDAQDRFDEKVTLDGVTYGGSSYAWNEVFRLADETLCYRLLDALAGARNEVSHE